MSLIMLVSESECRFWEAESEGPLVELGLPVSPPPPQDAKKSAINGVSAIKICRFVLKFIIRTTLFGQLYYLRVAINCEENMSWAAYFNIRLPNSSFTEAYEFTIFF